MRDCRRERSGSEISNYVWNRKPIYYRPGTSDPDVIYNVLLKPGKKAEYWVPDVVDPEVILDIGSNIGISAVYFASRYPKAGVYSFEPMPENFTLLSKNISAYRDNPHHLIIIC